MSRGSAALALCLLAACDRGSGQGTLALESARPDARSEPAEAQGLRDDFVAQQLAMRTRTLAPQMLAAGPQLRGVLATGAEARSRVEVRAGHCYRFVTAGGVEAEDLDVTLLAPTGLVLEQEEAREDFPVLGRHPLCPPITGAYTLVVRMQRGSGQWGAQLVGTP